VACEHGLRNRSAAPTVLTAGRSETARDRNAIIPGCITDFDALGLFERHPVLRGA
jgi:hypothetical protein